MGPVSTSMLSTVDLELANFINPDLTWKRVTKGHRSASKRSRKPAGSLDVGVQLDGESPKRSEESSVSESEKLGVAVLGRRFTEKVEHMPIKKRRLLLRSPSPPLRTPLLRDEEVLSPQPQTPSPHSDEPRRHLDSSDCSGQWCGSKSISNQKIGAFDDSISVQFSEGDDGVKTGKISYNEDFSGIALLAAAACNNSIEDDADNVKEYPMVEGSLTPEGIDSSASATPSKETVSSSETVNFSLNDLVGEENTGEFVQDDTVDVLQNHHNDQDGGLVKGFVCSKDERLHWDLNTPMDAWEQPFEALDVDSQTNATDTMHHDAREKMDNVKDCETEGDPEGSQHDTEVEELSSCRKISADLLENNMFVVSRALDIGTAKEGRPLGGRSDAERTWFEEKIASTSIENSTEHLHACANMKASALGVSTEMSIDNCSFHGSDNILSTPVYEEKPITTHACTVLQNMEDCRTSAMSLESVQFGRHQNLMSETSVPRKFKCEIGSIHGDGSAKTSGLPDNRSFPREMISSVTCQISDVEFSVNNSGKLPSPTHENLSALDSFIEEGQSMENDDAKGQEDKAFAPDTTLIDSSQLVMPKSYGHEEIQGVFISHESCESYGKDPPCHSGKIDSGDPSDDCNFSDVSHEGRDRMVDSESMTEHRTGYDSPFEDGELRESVLYPWEENEAEWETECVDYESDKGDAGDFDAADDSVSEKVGVELSERGDALKESSHSTSLKTKLSGWDQLPEGYECSDRTGEVNDGSAMKIFTSDCMDGSKTSRGNLLSHTEGTSCSSVLLRKDAGCIHRSRSNNPDDSYFRARGDFGSIKSLGRGSSSLQTLNRSQEDAHGVDSSEGYTDSRNHYATGFHRYDPGYRRPRSHIANSEAKFEHRDPRQPINYSSKGVYRPISRGRSLTDRDDAYGEPARDINCGRGQGRSRVCPQGVRRGPREEYHGHGSTDPAPSSFRVPPYVASRERSFSPVHNRAAHFSRPFRRSRSRSRTRSPLTWQERNVCSRRHSRSPDCGSEAKMQRMRFPIQKSSFTADEGDRFLSAPRGRFFPQSNPRWIGERNCVADRFRDRRSPVRIFRRSQMLDTAGAGSPERVKSDNYFRHVMRPGRYTDLAGGRGRGHRYNGSDDDIRKHDDNYEMVHRVRHYNNGGVVRRFSYDAEDNSGSRNSRNEGDCIRSSDRRNVQRSGREASGDTFRYNSNRMSGACPKSSGIQDYDEDASHRRG